jgi:hypothetical protein
MRHLSSADMIDLSEGAGTPAAAAHVESCAPCRRAVTQLRAAAQAATEVDVPEPSPLFWDHFSSRVREAIADEPLPGFAERVGDRTGFGWWAGRLAMVGALAALLIAVVIGTRPRWDDATAPTTAAMASTQPHAAAVASVGGETAGQEAAAEDVSLDLVADLSQGLDWDQTADAGMMVRVGSVDSEVAQLSGAERAELARLLEAQLSHTSS